MKYLLFFNLLRYIFIFRLSLTGRSVEAKSVPIEARSVLSSGREDTSLTSEYTHLEEEIFDQEGHYEEVIAIDYKDMYVFSFSPGDISCYVLYLFTTFFYF